MEVAAIEVPKAKLIEPGEKDSAPATEVDSRSVAL